MSVVLAAVIVNFFFMPPLFQQSVDQASVAGTLLFIIADSLIVFSAGYIRRSIQALEAANELEIRLNAELQHRMKNTLSIVAGIVRQTIKHSLPEEFDRTLSMRIAALSKAHDLLSDGRWELCELPQLAERALEPFVESGRVIINGPACVLRSESCVPLVLALHELATNAYKYGALSAPSGKVHLIWRLAGDKVLLDWTELGGPAVSSPTRRGLGSALIAPQKGIELAELHYNAEGLRCCITVAQKKAQSAERHLIIPANWKPV